MKWERKDQWHIQSGPYCICKAYVRGVARYTLSHGNTLVTTKDSAEECRAVAEGRAHETDRKQ